MRSFACRNKSTTWLVFIFIATLFILYSIRRRNKRLPRKNSGKDQRGLFRFDSHTRKIQVRNLNGDVILEGDLGMALDPNSSPPVESSKGGLHYTWDDHVLLSITKADKNCILVNWDAISDEPFTPLDCFHMGKVSWYGGGQLNTPSWPLNKANIQMAPFYAKAYSDGTSRKQYFTSVLERYWLSSSGVAIYVDENVPLHVSVNENGSGKLCLKADKDEYPNNHKHIHLKYHMCFGNNIKSTHKLASSKYIAKPSESLSGSITRYPFCSVKSSTQTKLTRFFRSIVIRQFPCGHINLGLLHGLEFNKLGFPNPKKLIQDIQSKKMKVSAYIDLSFSKKSKIYENIPKEFLHEGLMENSLYLPDNKAREWFSQLVLNFQKDYGVDTVRFSCEELRHSINDYRMKIGQNPGILLQNYAKLAGSLSKSVDISVGYMTQSLPLVIKIADRNAEWGKEMGLRSIIPMVLSIGVLGYPYVTIGPVGGKPITGSMVEKELYIRWMQMSVFFPVMEFITYPWEYEGSETVQASTDILDIRHMLWDNMLTIAQESVDTGAPIIRPMWWLYPDDPVTYNLSSQFMLGDIYLVAPILWSQTKLHEVYMPKGVWREMFGEGAKHEIEVGEWVRFSVELKTIIYFECLICGS